MILSRAKPAIAGEKNESKDSRGSAKKQIPTIEEFLSKRDYTGRQSQFIWGPPLQIIMSGAMAVLEFNRHSGGGGDDVDMWLGYCAFHLGDYKRAMLEYEALTHSKSPPKSVWINLAVCYFYLGMYKESEKMAEKGEKSRLKTRLMFHLSHKFGDEKKLMKYHSELEDVIEDQLSLASIHYLRLV